MNIARLSSKAAINKMRAGIAAHTRANKKLGELPVVLVTALASREHRERGIDVGANAYIVKSSFDQSNLLETVDRFI